MGKQLVTRTSLLEKEGLTLRKKGWSGRLCRPKILSKGRYPSGGAFDRGEGTTCTQPRGVMKTPYTYYLLQKLSAVHYRALRVLGGCGSVR